MGQKGETDNKIIDKLLKIKFQIVILVSAVKAKKKKTKKQRGEIESD